jgi:hypothetical protein
MGDQSYSTSFEVEQSPKVVFDAVTNVRGWWSQDIKGDSSKLNDEFIFEVPDVHYSKQKLIEVIAGKRVVWRVTESNMTFLEQSDEWTGTKMIFDIVRSDNTTRLTFTHEGLVPEVECYKFCMPAWVQYIDGSLQKLIVTGRGTPNLEGKTIEKPAFKQL